MISQLDALCLCCSDIQRYRRKVSDVVHKIQLTTYLLDCQNLDIKEYEVFKKKFHNQIFILQNDCSHVHFMCGSCRKVDDELSRKEDQLRSNLYKVFFFIYKTGDETMYYNTLRILQGDYSITYRCLERLWFIRKKEVKE